MNPEIEIKAKRTNGRQWIYVKKVTGRLFRYRQYVGYFLLGILFAGPLLKINGEPLLMFNIIERKFSVFGSVFYPQDLHIFVLGMLIAMVCIVLFTVVYGRVWCGWACPQTIFMELVFRRIEYWIEGDAAQQRKLDQAPVTRGKVLKKLIKHGLFFLLSFLIANLFLSYIIGADALFKIVTDPIKEHVGGFVAITLFTLVFYAVFAYMREIVCTTICPYGRLQGVLLDDRSTTVVYNYKRGEPRGKIQKNKVITNLMGDCIDCNLCVQVCPTGIDIRKGIQMECVNCTACIDVCDGVMAKLNRPKRLIGFYSTKSIENPLSPKSNTRTIAYSSVLALLMIIFGWLIFNRSIIDGTLLRTKGTSYIFRDDGTVANLYSLDITNKGTFTLPFTIENADDSFDIQVIANKETLKKGESLQLSFFLIIPRNEVKTYKTSVDINILSAGKIVKKMSTTFIAPPNGGKTQE
ncbi:cytochrome c oxidase accessory protein CcoG [Olivibacter sp. SDN3]|nr:cytochrome c oxidase accessory protein CcoG [Olivibacter sp. SDN3]